MKRVEIIDGVPHVIVDYDEDVVIMSTGYKKMKGMLVDEHKFEHKDVM